MNLTIPMPPYLPDQSAVSGGLNVCNNVYPKVDGYGPIAGFTGFSAALTGIFKGGASFIAKDATSTLLVGTTTNLLKFSGATWTSLVGALTVTEQWRFAQFGDFAISVNGSATRVVNLVTSVATTLAGAPVGKSIAIVGDYVVIGQNTNDLSGIFTSGTGDHTKWDVVTTDATYQPMLEGGEVQGLAGGEYGVILQRRRIVRMSRTGDTNVPFAYDVVSNNIGCASKGSVAAYRNRVYFLSDAGFKCIVAGQEPIQDIGSEKVDRTFAAEVARDDWERIHSAIDPQSKVVIWCVPGTPGKLWIYNWELDRWSTATLSMDGVFSGFTSSTDLDSLNVTYPSIDAMTISLDDPRWQGGNPRLYAVQAGVVGTFFGTTLEAEFDFSFSELAKGRVSRIRAMRPVGDIVAGMSFAMDARARLGDAENIRTVTDLRTSGIMPIRHSGRYVRPNLTVAAGTSWGYISALELEVEAGGER